MNPHEQQQSAKNIVSQTNQAEDEHFRLSESLISWMEHFKTTRRENPEETLSSILPEPSTSQKLYYTSPQVIALNLVRNFGRRQDCDNLPASLNTSSYILELNKLLDDLQVSRSAALESSTEATDETARSQYNVANDDDIQAIVDQFTVASRVQTDTIESTVIDEDNVEQLISDKVRLGLVIETLLSWLSSSKNYSNLTSSYYAANHLLKTLLDAQSTSHQIDLYSGILIDVCLVHPQSVQIFSPYLSPSICSAQCFLHLYKTVCSRQSKLGPMATFVLLSKFDIKSWLSINSTHMRKGYHELVVTTCSAFKDIGKNSDMTYELTMDLLRRHLQTELASPSQTMPDELILVLGQFLNLINEQALAPDLWFDFLAILGTESQNCTSESDLSLEDSSSSSSNCKQHQQRAPDRIWPSFLFWLARITQVLGSSRSSGHLMVSGNASKLITAWLRMLVMLEHQLERLVLSSETFRNPALDDTNHHHHHHSRLTESSSGENVSALSSHANNNNNNTLQDDTNQDLKSSSSSASISATLNTTKSSEAKSYLINLSSNHKCLLELIKQLISLYDSINSGGLWAYLSKSNNKSEQLVKVSITSLSIACFLASRALSHTPEPATLQDLSPQLLVFRDELAKLQRVSLVKLRAARKSKSFNDCTQFIDTLIASVKQDSRVQYAEVVQLITGFSLIESSQHHQHQEDSS